MSMNEENPRSCLGGLWTLYMIAGLIAVLMGSLPFAAYATIGLCWFLGMVILGI